MKLKTLKYIFCIVIGLFFLIGIVLTIRHRAFRNCSLSNYMRLDELQKLDLKVDYIETSEDWTDEWYNSFSDRQLLGAEECKCIIVANPTGEIYFNRGSILQEVYVKNVIKGECSYGKIWIQNGLNSTMEYKDGVVTICGMDRSFMQKDCEYLLFCDEMTANDFSNKKVYNEAEGMWFGCYNLTRDYNKAMNRGENKYNPEIEFYTYSLKTILCYNDAKHKLIDKYVYGK